jgi:hypothetical protein
VTALLHVPKAVKRLGESMKRKKNVLVCGDTRGRSGAIRGESVGREPFI